MCEQVHSQNFAYLCVYATTTVSVALYFLHRNTEEKRYIKIVYKLMLRDLERLPNTVNWASLVRHLLMSLVFYNVWLGQGVGNYDGWVKVNRVPVNERK